MSWSHLPESLSPGDLAKVPVERMHDLEQAGARFYVLDPDSLERMALITHWAMFGAGFGFCFILLLFWSWFERQSRAGGRDA